MTTFARRIARALVATLGLGLAAAQAAPADDDAVRQVLMAQFDKPEARLAVAPVAVAGNAAVASWAQGERGGRALLFRHAGQWKIALCAGDALKDAKVLQEAGVAPGPAATLARSLARAEARLTPAQRARFATFDGIVRMGHDGGHPPQHAR